MDKRKYRLILASQSPRRKELLGYLGIPFEVYPSYVDETPISTSPSIMVQDLSLRKALAIAKNLEGNSFLVVGADTTVSIENRILEKPANLNESKEMLTLLKNKIHDVYTGVALVGKNEKGDLCTHFNYVQRTKVYFSDLDEEELAFYLTQENTLDKAGAYGIQGPALSFVESIEGDFANVMGFPLASFRQKLKSFLQIKTSLRNYF